VDQLFRGKHLALQLKRWLDIPTPFDTTTDLWIVSFAPASIKQAPFWFIPNDPGIRTDPMAIFQGLSNPTCFFWCKSHSKSPW